MWHAVLTKRITFLPRISSVWSAFMDEKKKAEKHKLPQFTRSKLNWAYAYPISGVKKNTDRITVVIKRCVFLCRGVVWNSLFGQRPVKFFFYADMFEHAGIFYLVPQLTLHLFFKKKTLSHIYPYQWNNERWLGSFIILVYMANKIFLLPYSLSFQTFTETTTIWLIY